jgi:uncharacterized protein (TIGR02118 family)
MSIAYFLELSGQPQLSTQPAGSAGLPTQQLQSLIIQLQQLPAVQCIDLFTPQAAHDPLLDDGLGPLLVLQMRVSDQQALAQLLASEALRQVLSVLRALPVTNSALLQEALKLERYDVPEDSGQPGALSYLVNYQRPAADEPAFLDYYRRHHPPIMRRFAGLRSLELGLPLGWCPLTDISWADRMLFCDVSFDNSAALNAALASSVRRELRRDFEKFPPFSGSVTHYAMRRQRLLPASV